MVVVSYSGKEINAKLVYYGAGLSGKTTNLESIYEAVPDTSRGKMVSMKTQSDRTLFFDLLPLDLGEIMGFKTRFLLYTVPGQVFYNATRKLVLKGADAIVFVADSEVGKMEENRDSLANLKANLAEYGVNLDSLPWVIQYNKRDLPNVYSLEELNAELNPGGKVPFFEAVAKDGKGVFETFRGISHLLMEKVTKDLRRGPQQTPMAPSAVASQATAMPATPAPAAAPPVMPAAPMSAAFPAAPAPAVPKPAAPPAPTLKPAALPHTPVAPAREPVHAENSGPDYGRELELPGEARTAPAPAPKLTPVVTPAAGVSAAVQAQVAAVLDQAAMPAPPVHAAQPAPAAVAPHAPTRSNDEVVVPVTLKGKVAHEIVLRIVLKVED